jgi:hypothetical protein
MDKKKPISFSKLDKVIKTGLHQYEPIATDNNTTEDGEILITKATRWIPMCELAKSKNDRDPKLVLFVWEIDAIRDAIEAFYEKGIAKQFMATKDCHECLALCFREHLEMLDVMPLRELFPSEEEDDTEEDGFDF